LSLCDADAVQRDAFATWSVQDQAWELGSTYDQMSCAECGEQFNEAKEVEALE
jgi:formylmethanofuran dehydrogenase subunit E